MLVMGRASIRPLLRIVGVDKSALYACILALVVVGAYSHEQSLFEVGTVLGFGVLGYLLNRFDFSAAACVLGFVLGPLLESSFRRALILSDESLMIFVERPISAVLLIISFLTFVVPLIRATRASGRVR